MSITYASPASVSPAASAKQLIRLKPGLTISLGATCLDLGSGAIHPATVEHEDLGWRCRFEEGFTTRTQVETIDDSTLVLSTVLRNENPQRRSLVSLVQKGLRVSGQDLDRVYWHTRAMDGFSGIDTSREPFRSSGVCGITNAPGESAFLCGFVKFDTFLGDIRGEPESVPGDWSLDAACCFQGRVLEPGEEITMSPLWIAGGRSLWGLLATYAEHVGEVMGTRRIHPVLTGWCSWYHYYGRETESDLLKNLDELSNSPIAGALDVFQIDDGWNLTAPDEPRNWGDWVPGAKFPRGMKWMADQIRDRGMKPGLWLAPFVADRASNLVKEHPEWLVQKRDEETGELRPLPLSQNSNVFALDLTQAAVLEFLRQTFRRVFSEWGYDYVKIDFLQLALLEGIRADDTLTPVQAFRQGMEVIRQESGNDRYILACGSPFGPAIGLCDGMRIGFDVGGGWDATITMEGWPNGNCCIKSAVFPSYYRHWMHGRWWHNDPDCLMVRDKPVSYEVELTEARKAKGMAPQPPGKLCLSEEEAEGWVKLVWMLGGLGIVSEVWSGLSPERQQLLARAFPPNSEEVGWLDWHFEPEVGLLRTEGDAPLMIGVFNFSDEPKRISFPSAKLGLAQWKFTELWAGDGFVGGGEIFELPVVPPHGGRIWRLAS